jgi:opacity protein-like surface antigen
MKYFYLLLTLLFPIYASAQISLGVIGGVNYGKFGGVAPSDAVYASKAGLNLGGTIAYRINKDISITLQPLYSQRGSNIEVGEDSWRDTLKTYEVQIDFFVIPLYVRIDSDNGIVYFSGGIEFGIPLSAQISLNDESKDLSDKLNRIDLLASVGMGLRFSLGKPDLLIGIRYYQGLVNFNSANESEQGKMVFEDFKNNGFQLMAGVEWKL